MNLNDLTNAFAQEDTALEVLNECSCYFSKIDEISDKLATGQLHTPDDYRTILNEGTSIYLALNPILSIARTEKENREMEFFVNRKIEVEKKGDKFVSTAADKEASLHVANYRRIRNILEGYIEASKMVIMTCQSILKSMSDEARIAITSQTT